MKEQRNGEKPELWGSGLSNQEQEPAGRVAPDLRPVRRSGLNRRNRHSSGRIALSAGRLGRYVMRRSQTKLPKTTASTSDRHEKSRKLSRDKTCAVVVPSSPTRCSLTQSGSGDRNLQAVHLLKRGAGQRAKPRL